MQLDMYVNDMTQFMPESMTVLCWTVPSHTVPHCTVLCCAVLCCVAEEPC